MKKVAGFWIRFITGFVDITIITGISFIFAYLLFWDQNFVAWKYYLWGLLTIIEVLLLRLVIPFFTNQSLAQKLFKIEINFETKITSKKQHIKQIMLRESLLSLSWIAVFFVSILMIYPSFAQQLNTNFGQFYLSNQNLSLDKRIILSIVLLMSKITGFIFLINAISILFNKKHSSFADRLAKTRIVYKYRQLSSFETFEIKPILSNWQTVEWKEEI